MLPWVKENLERLEESDWCNALQLVFAYFELHPGQKWASRFVLLDVAMKSADRTYSPRSEDLVWYCLGSLVNFLPDFSSQTLDMLRQYDPRELNNT